MCPTIAHGSVTIKECKMLIHMQEVNFGEAILLEQDRNQLLVDCGAKYEHKGITAAQSVRHLLSNFHKKALVTHFDEDHYNGFTELAGRTTFEQFYLPLFAYKHGAVIETYKILDNTVKIWCYHKLFNKGKKLDALHLFFKSLPQLVPNRDRVLFLKNRDTISCGNKTFEVLWPDSFFIEDLHLDSSPIEEDLRRTLSTLYSEMERHFETELKADYLDAAQYIEMVNNYANAFIELYIYYVAHADEAIEHPNYNDLINNLNVAYEALDANHFPIRLYKLGPLGYALGRRITVLTSKAIKCMNDCSIVMQCDNEILMLGDIGRFILEHSILFDFRIKDEYKAVKVSHHGTKPYFSDQLPTAKVYLISNSGKSNTSWRISEKYPLHYSKDKMMCTNTNPKRCIVAVSPCVNCCIGNSNGNRLIDLDIL